MRTKGAKCADAPLKSFPKDLQSYIKKVKIPMLEDTFCYDEDGNPIAGRKQSLKDIFISLFLNCKSEAEADRITLNYIDANIDKYIDAIPGLDDASPLKKKKEVEIDWSSFRQMTIFDFLA